MTTFDFDITRFGVRCVQNAEKVARKFAFDLHGRIVKRMPVDTGRAKANTQISIARVPASSTDGTDDSPRGSIGAANSAAAGMAIARFRFGDTAFVYNNVEYILPLEYGRSRQAPQGMFRISFEEELRALRGPR